VARVVQKNVRGVPYIQVVEDYKDEFGVWRQKVLKSFGSYNPMAFFEAQGYAAQVNAFRERAPNVTSPEWEPWEKAAAAIIGGLAVAWLLSQISKKR
jgi:hypothetical protein